MDSPKNDSVPPVEIYPQDEENRNAAIEKIRDGQITDESEIAEIVASYDFSTQRTRLRVQKSIMDLLHLGALKQDFIPMAAIKLPEKKVDIKREKLITNLKNKNQEIRFKRDK